MSAQVRLLHKTIHFLGIGGSGMIALAQYLRSKGRCKVTGSDLRDTAALQELAQQGVKVFCGHDASYVKQADVVVVSSAIPEDNCEFMAMKAQKKTWFSRGEFLALLMGTYKRQVSVAGSHGKTTMTGMLVHVLDQAGVTPSFMVGGELPPYFVNGRYSESTTFVTESDESDGSFLSLTPNFSILGNIELEHMNYYQTEHKLMSAFKQYVKGIADRKGVLVVNKDDDRIQRVLSKFKEFPVLSFSLSSESADIFARDVAYTAEGISYEVVYLGSVLGKVRLALFGEHNVANSLAVILLALSMNVSFSSIQKGLARFQGVKRRMQLISEHHGIRVYDDYGHHPTEIKTTLNGLKRALDRPLYCVFQPHRVSRVKQLMDAFFDVFKDVDEVLLTPIYMANEVDDDAGIMKAFIAGVKEHSQVKVQYFSCLDQVTAYLIKMLDDGDVVVTMGAGDVHVVSTQLSEQLDRALVSDL